ncbi:hypothetical protein DSO57_1028846 [Entomophthora muscae]|uniref:Uncharacterized protein n=1 Tax=Entomophthora muscae TaxID=34485 RepID=A0ACC2SQP2_9FUNG|nr:hypothetical protein DSO57_1028846 [Entomophthora muscae]
MNLVSTTTKNHTHVLKMALKKQYRACNSCRRRKVKCTLTFENKCKACIVRNEACSLKPTTSIYPVRLPPVGTMQFFPDPRFGRLLTLLHRQTALWKLDIKVPSLVMSFFMKAGPNNIYFPIDIILELFNESNRPDILPVILSVMEYHVSSSEASYTSFLESLSSLQEPKHKLLLTSLSFLPPESINFSCNGSNFSN